ncbi:MAG: DUF72 domain-containing protein [Ilumatobacteraceae bacterium]
MSDEQAHADTGTRALPSLHVGCPMWANRAWVGRHLPGDTAAGTELSPYSRLLNAVEGNTTFYASPSPASVAKWSAQATRPFRMVVKAPREITHDRRLRDVGGLLREFADLLAPLDDALGGVMLQLPASFGPADLDALDSTAAVLPGGIRWSVEVRHHEFCGGPSMDALHRLLERHGLERVVLDTTVLFSRPPRTEAGHDEWRTKPRLPLLDLALTDRPVVRYVGGDDADRVAAGLDRWSETLGAWLHEGRSPTFFVHTPDNADTPALARGLHEAVAAANPGVPPLAEPLPVHSAEQASLF